jgi:hypothetical protein
VSGRTGSGSATDLAEVCKLECLANSDIWLVVVDLGMPGKAASVKRLAAHTTRASESSGSTAHLGDVRARAHNVKRLGRLPVVAQLPSDLSRCMSNKLNVTCAET